LSSKYEATCEGWMVSHCDPELTDILINRSVPTLKWMRTKGVGF